MKKRRSPIAKNLLNNSISAMISTIEIHNKPELKYRYETVVLLLLNSWELLLKSYLYKNHKKDVRLFEKDGRTKPFENCLNIVSQKIGMDFNPTKENLEVLYNYRNQVAHFYLEEINPILFSLVSKSIIFYNDFIKFNFTYDLSEKSDLILLPIGFKKPISPIDYISNTSVNKNATKEVRDFLKTIIVATENLHNQNIDETIFVEFKMNLTNVNRIKNADLIAGIDNTRNSTLTINTKPLNYIKISEEGQSVAITKNREDANGIILYEGLQENIFEEINNVIDINRLLAKEKKQFILGPSVYFRIYSEREYINFKIEDFEILSQFGAIESYSPFLYWLVKLPSKKIALILYSTLINAKHPNILNYIKLCFILDGELPKLTRDYLEDKYRGISQKPSYYYAFNEILKSKQRDKFLKSHKFSSSKKISASKTFKELKADENYVGIKISELCIKTFKENTTKYRAEIRDLDFIYYYDKFKNVDEIIDEIKSLLTIDL